LWNNYRLFSHLIHFKELVRQISGGFKLKGNKPSSLPAGRVAEVSQELYRQGSSREIEARGSTTEAVNERLLQEGLISAPLTAAELTGIVDILSPTAGAYYKNRGIEISKILGDCLPNFELECLETYNHLGKISSKNKFSLFYDYILKKLYPETGALFLAVLKKAAPRHPSEIDNQPSFG
jgi:hypothetical protein